MNNYIIVLIHPQKRDLQRWNSEDFYYKPERNVLKYINLLYHNIFQTTKETKDKH